jgi:hypothetical protein
MRDVAPQITSVAEPARAQPVCFAAPGAHVVEPGAGVPQMRHRHPQHPFDLGGIRDQGRSRSHDPDHGCDQEVRHGDQLVELAQNGDGRGIDAELLPSFAQRRGARVRVFRIAAAARERHLALVVIDGVGALGEDHGIAGAALQQQEHGRRNQIDGRRQGDARVEVALQASTAPGEQRGERGFATGGAGCGLRHCA